MVRTNAALFENKAFDLPLIRSEENILAFHERIYSEYLNTIARFNKELRKKLTPKIPFIENQITKIKNSLKFYLQGFPSRAYAELSTALTDLLSQDYLPLQPTDMNGDNSPFYRARISSNRTLRRDELFHIPFELREKVSTQRYSIPGLPCLYLADSIFVCWEELGRPNIDTLHVSRVDISQSGLRFLFFNISTDQIRKKCFSNKFKDGKLLNLLVPFLCYWPMLAACSIVVRKPEEVFKPEYIIPQLLLQWVVNEQKVDGVVYRSNRIKVSHHNMGTFHNLVIPVRKIEEKGFCPELRNKIKLTQPVSLQFLQIIGTPNIAPAVEISALRRAMYIELIEGEKSIYSNTIFGLMENKLHSLVAQRIP